MNQTDMLPREEFARQMERLRELKDRQEELSNDERAALWELADQLAATRVQLQGEAEAGVLDIGAILILRELISGREVTVQLVPDLDAVWRRENVLMVSRESPTGQMLIGRKVGDQFTVNGMGSAQELVYEIVSQARTPGDSRD
jgi:transcription elongation GreA/GreB family factor